MHCSCLGLSLLISLLDPDQNQCKDKPISFDFLIKSLLKVVQILVIMEMAGVMMSTTMKPACLMEEITVVVLLIHLIAQNVYVLRKEEGSVEEKQQLLELPLVEAAIRE